MGAAGGPNKIGIYLISQAIINGGYIGKFEKWYWYIGV